MDYAGSEIEMKDEAIVNENELNEENDEDNILDEEKLNEVENDTTIASENEDFTDISNNNNP